VSLAARRDGDALAAGLCPDLGQRLVTAVNIRSRVRAGDHRRYDDIHAPPLIASPHQAAGLVGAISRVLCAA
jgi:hypothetical protein